MTSSKNKIEFGDFQTPLELARDVCRLVKEDWIEPSCIIEPTCGIGNFVIAATEQFISVKKVIAADINQSHVQIAQGRVDQSKVEMRSGDFFEFDWSECVKKLPEPILVIGNLPWVTNSQLGSISGSNLPLKNNIHELKGFDALTGKSNFDISEWMLIRLAQALSNREAVLAMLCKISVAKKLLAYLWKNDFQISKSAIYAIDAKRNFNVNVDACLLAIKFSPKGKSRECRFYSSLDAKSEPRQMIGFRGGRVVADVELYDKWKRFRAQTKQEYKWRSGVKHDCSKVMELRWLEKNFYQNGLGETVELEKNYLYPLVKSSDLFNGREPSRWVIMTQKMVSGDTSIIEKTAPKTWHYLKAHQQHFSKRASVIYKNRQPFSIFGVGDYSFSKWKVAISGLYKEPRFRLLGECFGKSIIPDDTVNFIPFESESEARFLADALNSKSALSFLKSMTFDGAKRPFTIELLSILDIEKLTGKEPIAPLFPIFARNS